MSFVSSSFILFFVALLGLCSFLEGRTRKSALLLASYYFYMAVDWRFLGLLLLNTAVHYIAGTRIESATGKARQAWLGLSIFITLGVLAYFKYASFFVESFAALLRMAGLNPSIHVLEIALPIGISFFSFQAIGYSIDVYRRKLRACRDPLAFALFIGFFAQLLAGPIGRGTHLLPQWEMLQPPVRYGLSTGFGLMLRGYLKKLIVAEPIGIYLVDPAFAAPGSHSSLFLFLAVIGFSFYLYLDFSGYTDIARGAARSLGYELAENFNRPYRATTVSNFWQRWHMSMSSFFRDYLFISLGGSRKGNVYLNLILTFVGIGLWHGAGWNFVVYGALHGGIVGLERWLRLRRERLGTAQHHLHSRFSWGLSLLWTFTFVAFSRILFRSEDLPSAIRFASALLTQTSLPFHVSVPGVIALASAVLLHMSPKNWSNGFVRVFSELPLAGQFAIMACVLIAVTSVGHGSAGFVYFQF